MTTVAVIGAGISGLACARALAENGLDVTVFEKSRGVGGRMATRRTETGLTFDHGAQYFTARQERFLERVRAWEQAGIVRAWNGRIVSLRARSVESEQPAIARLVAVPGMNALCTDLARDLRVRVNTRIEPPCRHDGKWLVLDDEGTELGQYDIVIVSAPAPQAEALLQAAPDLAGRASEVTIDGCWAVLAEFADRMEPGFDGAIVHDSPLSWIARDSSKPGRRTDAEAWVLHASPEWTRAHLGAPNETIVQELLAAFRKATGVNAGMPRFVTAHRWRFALPTAPLTDHCLFDHERMIGACGDWCRGPRVEGAMLSGLAVADRTLNALRSPPARTAGAA
jgi:predicted NAD/FAD-dependent oxidoreductase